MLGAEQPPADLMNCVLINLLPKISSAITLKYVYAFTLIFVSIYAGILSNSNIAQHGVGFSSIIKVYFTIPGDFVYILIGTLPPFRARYGASI